MANRISFEDRRWRWIAGTAVFVLVAIAVVVLRPPSTGSTAGPSAFVIIDRGTITQTVSASGKLAPVGTVQLSAPLDGVVAEVLVDFNAKVTAGQVLARLDDEGERAALAQAEAVLTVAQSSLARAQASRDLADANIRVAQASLDGLQAQVGPAQSAGDAAQQALDRANTLAAAGVVAKTALDDAGDVLTDARTHVTQLTAQIAGAQAALDGRMSDRKGADADVAVAEATLAQRQAQIDAAQHDLTATEVRAPVAGVVVNRAVDVGTAVTVPNEGIGTPMFVIAEDLAAMENLLSVDEADVTALAVGMPVTFVVDSYPNRTFAGRVQEIRLNPATTQNVVTYTVVASANNPDHALLPGMTTDTRIVVAQAPNVVRIPQSALRYSPPGAALPPPLTASSQAGTRSARVYVAGLDGTPLATPVVLGASDANYLALVSGNVAEGQHVYVGQTAQRTGGGFAFGGRFGF